VRDVLVVVAVVAGVWLLAVVALAVLGKRIAARALVRLVPDVVRLFRGLLGDPRVPLGSKLLLGLAVAWLVSPIDLLPEFLPVLGPLDDAVVAALVVGHLVRRAGPDVVREHWRGDEATLRVLLRVGGVRGGRGRLAPERP